MFRFFQRPSVIAVLGNGMIRNGVTEELPAHVVDRLNIAAEMYQKEKKEKKCILAVVGRGSFWNRNGTFPTTTEADAMQQYLLTKGVLQKEILVEKKSEDTNGNALYLKEALKNQHIKDLTVFCADYHKERVEYIFKRVFGEEIALHITATPGPFSGDELKQQKEVQMQVLEGQKNFLEQLLADPELIHNLYGLSYYTDQLRTGVNEAGKSALGLENAQPMQPVRVHMKR